MATLGREIELKYSDFAPAVDNILDGKHPKLDQTVYQGTETDSEKVGQAVQNLFNDREVINNLIVKVADLEVVDSDLFFFKLGQDIGRELRKRADVIAAADPFSNERKVWYHEADMALLYVIRNFPVAMAIGTTKSWIVNLALPFNTQRMAGFDVYTNKFRDFIMAKPGDTLPPVRIPGANHTGEAKAFASA